jgi:hypothetical protein
MGAVKATNEAERFIEGSGTAVAQEMAMPISDGDWQVLQHEVSRYIASMTAEMATMARSAKLDLLVYFLDMAHVEATTQSEQTDH